MDRGRSYQTYLKRASDDDRFTEGGYLQKAEYITANCPIRFNNASSFAGEFTGLSASIASMAFLLRPSFMSLRNLAICIAGIFHSSKTKRASA